MVIWAGYGSNAYRKSTSCVATWALLTPPDLAHLNPLLAQNWSPNVKRISGSQDLEIASYQLMCTCVSPGLSHNTSLYTHELRIPFFWWFGHIPLCPAMFSLFIFSLFFQVLGLHLCFCIISGVIASLVWLLLYFKLRTVLHFLNMSTLILLWAPKPCFRWTKSPTSYLMKIVSWSVAFAFMAMWFGKHK